MITTLTAVTGVPSFLRSPQSRKSPVGITWWAPISGKDDFPTLFQYALDTLSCPVMSTEWQRVFGSIKNFITSERNQLEEDIIEACELPKGVVEKPPDRAAVWTFQEVEAIGGSDFDSFNSRDNGKVNTLQQQGRSLYTTQSNAFISTIPYFWLYPSCCGDNPSS